MLNIFIQSKQEIAYTRKYYQYIICHDERVFNLYRQYLPTELLYRYRKFPIKLLIYIAIIIKSNCLYLFLILFIVMWTIITKLRILHPKHPIRSD